MILCHKDSDRIFAPGIFTGLSILVKHVIPAPLPLMATYIARMVKPKSFTEITLYIPSSYGYSKNIIIIDEGRVHA